MAIRLPRPPGALRRGRLWARGRRVLAPYRLVLLVFLLLVVAVVWADQPGVFTPDTVPGLYTAPDRLLDADLSTWQPDPFLGSAGLQVGRAPVSAFLAALAATGLPDWALIRLWRSLLLVVAALGAHALYRRWAGPRAGRGAAVVMAVVYTANPYVVVGGSTTPTLLPYAFLPWAVLALVVATGSRGWRAPAGFALALFAMSGIQVGVVPLLQLLVVPVVVLDARLRRGVRWRTVLTGLARCATLGLVVSAYWIVPSLQAIAVGAAVAGATETQEVIAGPSSAAEVLRGLGMWTMYGRDQAGPFQPGFVPYVTSWPVLLASSALPVLAALGAAASRSRLRVAGVLAVAVAVPVMVGLHPFEDPTPFGRLLAAGFESVPGLIAFRTTNKAGGVLMLGLALLVALLAQRVLTAARGRKRRLVLAVVTGAVLVGGVAPALTGPLHPVRLELPDYWQEAAESLDAEPEHGRVLVLPGTHVPTYRWGYTSPADIPEAIFRRGTVQRQGVPNGAAQAADLLAALDTALQAGTLEPGTISTVARYLGVQDVLLRHDLVWEAAAGARPADVAARAELDPGLQLVAEFGRPGENVVADASAPTATLEQVAAEATLPPVQHYRVSGPVPQVRAERLGGTVLVDGDSSALSDLLGAGLLQGRPSYRLLGGMSAEEVEQALADGARVVLTDTARRRDTAAGRLVAATGPTLPRSAEVERSLAAFPDPSAQTAAVLPGGRVSATQSGSVFGPVPYGSPALALDGELSTGWLPGDFGTATGQRLDVELDRAAPVRQVRLTPLASTPSRLAEVRLQAGDVTREVALSPGEETVVLLPGRPLDRLSVTVTRIEGEGAGAGAGLAELAVDGVELVPTTDLPLTTSRLREQLSDRGRRLLDRAPQDVVLSRSRAREDTADDDEEARLTRRFRTTGTRTYDVGGVLRTGPDLPEPALDVLRGGDPSIAATSSSRFFDDMAVRASAALDGDPATAWVPGREAVGEWIDLAFPPRQVGELVLQQEASGNALVDVVTRVRVDLEDGRSVEADVGAGRTTVSLPPGPDVGLLRLTLLDRAGTGVFVRIAEVEVAGVRVQPDPVRADTACVTIGTLAGRPIAVTTNADRVLAGFPAAFSSCTEPVRLLPGEQQLRTAPGFLLDRVHLQDQRPPSPRGLVQPPAPRLQVTSDGPTSWTAEARRATAPYALVLGQGWDPRWEASVDGRDLGPPIVLDGWSAGWRVDVEGPHAVEVRYGLERGAAAARALSLLGLLACLLLLLSGLLRSRSSTGVVRPARPGAGSAPAAVAGALAAPGARRRRRGRVAAWGLVPVLMWFVGGPVVGGAGLVVSVLGARYRWVATALPWIAVLLLAAVPVVRLAAGTVPAARVSAAAATGGAADLLAVLGLALLVVGVLAQELRGRDGAR